MVNEYTAHHIRRQAKELCSILPIDAALIDQPKVRFMHQGGRLKRVIGSLATHIGSRQPPKLVVDLGKNLIERSIIPVPNIDQQLCQALGIRILHCRILPEHQGIYSNFEELRRAADNNLGVSRNDYAV
jgi:hypothetical protein